MVTAGLRRRCHSCHRQAAITRMVHGPAGQLFGLRCAKKRGLLPPLTARGVTVGPRLAVPPPARRSEAVTPSLFDQLEETAMPATLPDRTRDDTRPDVAALSADSQHFVVLQALEADLIKPVAEKQGLLGRQRILTRHAPHLSRYGSPSCKHCFNHAATGRDHVVSWPCVEYSDAAAGLVTGLKAPL